MTLFDSLIHALWTSLHSKRHLQRFMVIINRTVQIVMWFSCPLWACTLLVLRTVLAAVVVILQCSAIAWPCLVMTAVTNTDGSLLSVLLSQSHQCCPHYVKIVSEPLQLHPDTHKRIIIASTAVKTTPRNVHDYGVLLSRLHNNWHYSFDSWWERKLNTI